MNPAEAVTPVRVREGRADEAAAIDAWVRAHPGSTPFHRPAWIAGIAAATGQRAHMLIATRGGGLVGTLPLTAMVSPLFGRALASAGFAVGGGVLAADAAVARALVDAGWALADADRFPSLELRGGALPEGEGWQLREGVYAGFVRSLAADDEAELKAIPRKHRAEVRKALAAELTVTIGRGADDLAAHYRCYAESVRNLGTPVFPRALFRETIARFGDDADILTVRHAGRPVASVLSLYHHGTVLPYWGGGTREARGLRANELMYFSLMRHARDRDCRAFDFGRSKLGTGAFAYKKNWGFVPTPLAYAVRTADGASPREINPLSPRYRMQVAAWKKLPLWLANLLGPPLARGLG